MKTRGFPDALLSAGDRRAFGAGGLFAVVGRVELSRQIRSKEVITSASMLVKDAITREWRLARRSLLTS